MYSTQFVQQLKTIGNRFGSWRFQKGKVSHIAQVQRHHAQNDPGQRAAQYFRLGETWPAVEIFFVIKSNTNTVSDTAAATGALISCRLADRLNQQLLDLAAKAVTLDACQSGINHKTNTRHGQRCFGDVGGQHNTRCATGLEHALLLGLREAREQRQHIHVARIHVVRQMAAQVFGGFAYLTLARQKHQYIAARGT